MRGRFWFWLLPMLLALAGCATSDRLVEGSSKPQARSGYVAGKFRLERYPMVTAFVLVNDATGTEYLLPFTAKRNFDPGNEEATLVAVPPGSYRVKEWIVFNINFGPAKGWGREFTAPMREGALTRSFEVRDGEVLFLGAFVGDSQWTAGYPQSVTRGRWSAQPISKEAAKRSLASAFPHFAQAPFSCMACSP